MIQLQKIDRANPKIIQQLADNKAIALNLRHSFPHPYTLNDAVEFLELARNGSLGYIFGIYNDNFLLNSRTC